MKLIEKGSAVGHVLATALMLTLTSVAQADFSARDLAIGVQTAISGGTIVHAFMGVPAMIDKSNAELRIQQRQLLAELDKIPATEAFIEASKKIEQLDSLMSRLATDITISRHDMMKLAQPMIKSKMQLEDLRNASLKKALEGSADQLMLLSDETLKAVKASTQDNLKSLAQKIRQNEVRGLKVHMPFVLAGLALAVVTARDISVVDALQESIAALRSEQIQEISRNLEMGLMQVRSGN